MKPLAMPRLTLKPNPSLAPPSTFTHTLRPTNPQKTLAKATSHDTAASRFPVPHISFVGSVFVITGKFMHASVRDVRQFITQGKGQLHDLVSADVNYLIVGECGQDARKVALAHDHNVKIITETMLFTQPTKAWYTLPCAIPSHTVMPPRHVVQLDSAHTLPWTQKHRPWTEADLITAPAQLTPIKQFLQQWKALKPVHSALLLIGPPGVGKTSAVYALAHDMHFTVQEWNASSTRSHSMLEQALGGAFSGRGRGRGKERALQRSISTASSLLLMEEVDGIGTKDAGGMKFLTRLLTGNTMPVIMTANDRGRMARAGLLKNPAVLCITWSVPAPSVVLARLRDTVGIRERIPSSVFLMSADWKRILQSNDIRKAVQHLESLAAGQTIRLYDIDSDPTNMFEVARELFMNDMRMSHRAYRTENTTNNVFLLARAMFGSFPLMMGEVPVSENAPWEVVRAEERRGKQKRVSVSVKLPKLTLEEDLTDARFPWLLEVARRRRVEFAPDVGGVTVSATCDVPAELPLTRVRGMFNAVSVVNLPGTIQPPSKLHTPSPVLARVSLPGVALTHDFVKTQKSAAYAPEVTQLTMSTYSDVSDFLSLADNVMQSIQADQHEDLYPYYAWFACVVPSYAAERYAKSTPAFVPQVRLDNSKSGVCDEKDEQGVDATQLERTWRRLCPSAVTPIAQALGDGSFDYASFIESHRTRADTCDSGSSRHMISSDSLGTVISDETVSTKARAAVRKRKARPAKKAPAKPSVTKAPTASRKRKPSLKTVK